MLGLYFNELRKGISRIEFSIISMIILILCLSAFWVNGLEYSGASFSFVRKASQMTIITSPYSDYFLRLIVSLLPLLSGFLYSDNLILEKNNGTLSLLITRIPLKKVIIAKVFAVITIPFIILFFSLGVNLILTYLTFPSLGADNNLNCPAYDIGIQYSSFYAFDLLRLNSEWGYVWLYVLFISLFASVCSLFIFSIVNFIHKNSYITIIGIFMGFVIVAMVLTFLELDGLSWSDAFHSNALGSSWIPFVWLIGLSVISVGLIIIYAKTMELME